MLINNLYHIDFKSPMPKPHDIERFILQKTGLEVIFGYDEKNNIKFITLYRKERSKINLIFLYEKKKIIIEPKHSFRERYLYLTSLEAIKYFGGNIALLHPNWVRKKWEEMNPLVRLFLRP